MALHRWLISSIAALLVSAASAVGGEESPKKQRQPVSVPDIVVEQPPADAVNLIRNGGFELPDDAGHGPAHWQGIDRLVWNWQIDPSSPERGKVLRIDTDVKQDQAYQWWVQRFVHNQHPDQAPAPHRGDGPKYETVAGLEGGFYLSDYIPVKPGGAYKVYIDAKGPAAKVFIFGYAKDKPLFFGDEQPRVQEVFREARGQPLADDKGRPIRYRRPHLYRTWFAVGGSDSWQTYTHTKPRHPNNREITEDVAFIRIQIYPYWPPGDYWFDNVRVIEVQDGDPRGGVPHADEADYEEGKVIR